MPIFEYACNDCGQSFEALTFGGRAAVCPACQTENLTRKLSTFAVGASRGLPLARPQPSAGAGCGSCGDPRGPGACRMGEA